MTSQFQVLDAVVNKPFKVSVTIIHRDRKYTLVE